MTFLVPSPNPRTREPTPLRRAIWVAAERVPRSPRPGSRISPGEGARCTRTENRQIGELRKLRSAAVRFLRCAESDCSVFGTPNLEPHPPGARPDYAPQPPTGRGLSAARLLNPVGTPVSFGACLTRDRAGIAAARAGLSTRRDFSACMPPVPTSWHGACTACATYGDCG